MNHFQQEFLRWLDVNRKGFAVQPLFEAFDGLEATDRCRLRYRFEHALPCITLVVSTDSIRVEVFKDKVTRSEPWGIFFHEVACKIIECKLDDYQVPGHKCAIHDGGTYPPHTKEALILAEHCFEPLRQWIATTLQPAHWLVFGEDMDLPSAILQLKDDAELTSTEDDEGVHYDRRERLWSRRGRRSENVNRATTTRAVSSAQHPGGNMAKTIWAKSKFDSLFFDAEADVGEECCVTIGDGEIEVSYLEDDLRVCYRGEELSPGHFELKADGFDGRATLHRFAEGRVLEGYWVEDGYKGMWRIQLA